MASNSTRLADCKKLVAYIDNPNFSDFEIVCNSKHWKVHRLVLAIHSDVLGKACDSAFKESKEQRIDLSFHVQDRIEALVNYMYSWDYQANDDKPSSAMCFHLSMRIIADEYNIDGLGELAIIKFASATQKVSEGDELADVARLAYNTDGPIEFARQCIVAQIVRKSLLADGAAAPGLQDTVTMHPKLALEIIQAMQSAKGPPEAAARQYYCPGLDCAYVSNAFIPADRSVYTCPGCERYYPGTYWNL